jgi:hypothetical protein
MLNKGFINWADVEGHFQCNRRTVLGLFDAHEIPRPRVALVGDAEEDSQTLSKEGVITK